MLLAAYRAGILARKKSLNAVIQLTQSPVRLSDKLVGWFEGQLEGGSRIVSVIEVSTPAVPPVSRSV